MTAVIMHADTDCRRASGGEATFDDVDAAIAVRRDALVEVLRPIGEAEFLQ